MKEKTKFFISLFSFLDYIIVQQDKEQNLAIALLLWFLHQFAALKIYAPTYIDTLSLQFMGQ